MWVLGREVLHSEILKLLNVNQLCEKEGVFFFRGFMQHKPLTKRYSFKCHLEAKAFRMFLCCMILPHRLSR